MHKCPFCNSTYCMETKKIPRSSKEYICADKEVELMPEKYLYEMKCQNCNMTFTIDKDSYRD